MLAAAASARQAAAKLNTYNFSVTWTAKRGGDVRQRSADGGKLNATAQGKEEAQGAPGSHEQMAAWRVLRCDVASGAPFVAHLSIFIGGLPYKVERERESEREIFIGGLPCKVRHDQSQ